MHCCLQFIICINLEALLTVLISLYNHNTYSTYDCANDAAIIFLNMIDEGKVCYRGAHFVYTLPRQHNRHFKLARGALPNFYLRLA